MRKALLAIIIIFITSCSNDENEESIQTSAINEPRLNDFLYQYMSKPLSLFPNNDNDIIEIEYDSINRVIKRVGGFVAISPSTGYNYTFSDALIYNLTYLEQEIIIEQESELYELLPKTILLLDNDKIVQKIYENNFNQIFTYYNYNDEGELISSTEGDFPNRIESTYFYNGNKNIDSIISNQYNNDILKYKIVNIFSEFDQVVNPTKNLIVFDNTFFRSLSENNYGRYERCKYDIANNNLLLESVEEEWNLLYDENGNVIFNEL